MSTDLENGVVVVNFVVITAGLMYFNYDRGAFFCMFGCIVYLLLYIIRTQLNAMQALLDANTDLKNKLELNNQLTVELLQLTIPKEPDVLGGKGIWQSKRN
jgi:hypothetical protein